MKRFEFRVPTSIASWWRIGFTAMVLTAVLGLFPLTGDGQETPTSESHVMQTG